MSGLLEDESDMSDKISATNASAMSKEHKVKGNMPQEKPAMEK